MRRLILAAVAALWAGSAGAVTYTYQYVGGGYLSYTAPPEKPDDIPYTSSRLEGILVIDAEKLPSLNVYGAFNLSTGCQEYCDNWLVRTTVGSRDGYVSLAFAPDMTILNWRIEEIDGLRKIASDQFDRARLISWSSGSYYSYYSAPGTWTMTHINGERIAFAQTPVPATGLLLAAGMGVFWIRRRR